MCIRDRSFHPDSFRLLIGYTTVFSTDLSGLRDLRLRPISIVALSVEFHLAGETAVSVDKVSAGKERARDEPHQPDLEAVKRRRRVVNGQTKRGIGVRG